MEITILGQWGAYPKAGEATAGYLIEHNKEKILIDCGSGVLAQLQRYINLKELTAVIISHTHHDHVADLGCLQYACLIDTDLGMRTKVLPIYISDESNGNKYKAMMGTEIHSISTGELLNIDELSFTFFKTFHEAFCLAMKIQIHDKSMIYTADTYYHESLIPFCWDADLLIAETSFYKEIRDAKKYGHMNSSEVGTLANEANVGKVILTHLPHFGDVDKLAAEVSEFYQESVVLAHCGMKIKLV
jgi:ribonuclease BN (tRNA processing enzyme)